ncbi:MAG: L,D-transpeptidase family protein [Verrucomicrobiales bacterium]|nr:L,D-transpeptidase family protein [Verrucomicrobiales bacterium]
MPTLYNSGCLAVLLFALTSCGSPSAQKARPGETIYLNPHPANGLGTARLQSTTRGQKSFWNTSGAPAGKAKIVIDLGDQLASFYRGEKLVGMAPVSSGDADHPTPTGSFSVSQKDIDHKSNLYGDFMDDQGNAIVRNVSASDNAPAGSHFFGSPMSYFLRFNGAIGMHAGYLPGYPASHGCVRLPTWMAENFYNNSPNGTPVIVQH